MSEFFGDDGSGDPFWEQLGHEEGAAETEAPEQEAAPVATTDLDTPSEAAAEGNDAGTEAAPERARDENGRFVKAEPEAPEDDLQAKIQALEKRLADKDEYIGRQSQEVGELRRLQEQLDSIQQQVARPQVSDWDNLIDENPARAVRIALEAGDTYRYQQAKEAWDEIVPGASEMWEQNLLQQRRLDQLERQLQQTAEPLQHQAQAQQVAGAYQQIKERYPDFDEFEDAMAQTIETRPLIKESLQRALQSGDTTAQVEALDDLYRLTAGRASDTLRQAQKEVAQTLAAKTAQARQDAIVVSATSTNDAERAQPQTWWDVAEADEQRRAAGWNIGN